MPDGIIWTECDYDTIEFVDNVDFVAFGFGK